MTADDAQLLLEIKARLDTLQVNVERARSLLLFEIFYNAMHVIEIKHDIEELLHTPGNLKKSDVALSVDQLKLASDRLLVLARTLTEVKKEAT